MTAKEVERLIKADGWYKVDIQGSHHHYKHPTKRGKLTIPFHGKKELKKATANSILKQAGLK